MYKSGAIDSIGPLAGYSSRFWTRRSQSHRVCEAVAREAPDRIPLPC